jgi:hypothetical protein
MVGRVAVLLRVAGFAAEERSGRVMGALSGLPEPPPAAVVVANPTPNNKQDANARRAIRFNKFFIFLLILIGCRWPSIEYRWRNKCH